MPGALLVLAFATGCGSSKRSDEQPDAAETTGGSSSGTSGSDSAGEANGGDTNRGGTSARAGSGGTGGSIQEPPPCDGVPATSQIPRLTNEQYDRTVRDLLGVSALTDRGGVAPSALLVRDHQSQLTEPDWVAYQVVGEAIAAQVLADPELKGRFLACTPSGDGAACLHDSIVTFGRRAFRRPLSAGEVARFENIAAQGAAITEHGTAEEIAEVLLNTFLVSPSFLQRAELSPETDANGNFVLSQYELASRLSYMLWNTTPDETLDRAADRGELATSEQILAQAGRLLGDPRAHDVVTAFHRFYLQVANGSWLEVEKDPARFPNFTSAVFPAMKQETEAFFDTIVFRERGSFQDLFTSPLGFVNADLAPLYGLDPTLFGSTLSEVTLDAEQRPGFLSRIDFLATHSTYDRASPTTRGAFVLMQVLGQPFEPPASIPPVLPPPDQTFTTNRRMMEALTAGPGCSGCHTVLDAPGFVLEAYDASGAWQTVDALGGPIDTVADVLIGDDTLTIRDPAELMQALASSATAQRRYVERLVAFAYARDSALDGCWVDTLAARVAAGDYPVVELLAGLTQAPSFRLRAREP